MSKVWLLAIAVIIILLVMRVAEKLNVRRRTAGEGGRPTAPEEMVPCAVCGLHVPESEARKENHVFFCCEEHLRRGVG